MKAGEQADVVLGSRYSGGIRILNWSLGRLGLSLGANFYSRTLLGLKYADCTSGFRGYRRRALENLLKNDFHSLGYAFLVELLFEADRKGQRIVELPIVYTERRAGQSKMSRSYILEAVFRPWWLLLRRLGGK